MYRPHNSKKSFHKYCDYLSEWGIDWSEVFKALKIGIAMRYILANATWVMRLSLYQVTSELVGDWWTNVLEKKAYYVCVHSLACGSIYSSGPGFACAHIFFNHNLEKHYGIRCIVSRTLFCVGSCYCPSYSLVMDGMGQILLLIALVILFAVAVKS